ncbi:MAG: PqqD family protein [Alphaproteobacteria bacterium]|jgi:hypothetical protein|nr:PqqD family protein [Alphaproteobacteria bacterium]
MAATPMLLDFDGLSRPVAVADEAALLDRLPLVLPSWRHRESRSTAAPVIALSREDGRYRLRAARDCKSVDHADPVDALCSLVVELFWALVDDDSGLLCLHGAAAEFGGRLVVFPSRYRAGKSLLAGCLAAAGLRLFADDVLAVGVASDGGPDLGIASGVAPRLRLPLPDDLGAATRAFLERRRGPESRRYRYLDLGPEALAPRPSRAPIGGFVLLERESGAKPELAPLGDAAVLKQVVWQNFARGADSARILDRLHRLVGGAACFRLRYGRAEDAVATLSEAFANWDPAPRAHAPTKAPCPSTTTGADERTPKGALRQRAGLGQTMVDGELFLTDADGIAVYHLNPLAARLWDLLADPTTPAELIALLTTAFPDAEPGRVAADVDTLLDGLRSKGLLFGTSGEAAT